MQNKQTLEIQDGFWIMLKTDDGQGELCCEGAFKTLDAAQSFADAEVGVPVFGVVCVSGGKVSNVASVLKDGEWINN